MNDPVLLVVEGDVATPKALTWNDLSTIDAPFQIADVRTIDPKRTGGAVTLEGLLQHVGIQPSARYLTLHASADDFHASIPLAAVRDRGFFIYRQADTPLDATAGGPVRFYIPNFAACHTDDIDECANVKFVDRIEFSTEKGYDNRPSDDPAHEALHRSRDGE